MPAAMALRLTSESLIRQDVSTMAMAAGPPIQGLRLQLAAAGVAGLVALPGPERRAQTVLGFEGHAMAWAPIAATAMPVAIVVQTAREAAALTAAFQTSEIPAARYTIATIEQYGSAEAAWAALMGRFDGMTLRRAPIDATEAELMVFLRNQGIRFPAERMATAAARAVQRYLDGQL